MRGLLVAFVALLLTACASPPTTTEAPKVATATPASTDPPSSRPPAGYQANAIPVVELTVAQDGGKATVKRGGELKLVLDLQGMFETGWEMEKEVEPMLVQIGERIYVGNGANAFDVKAGGFSIFRFRAEQAGNVALQLTKRGRGDGKIVKTVRFDVTVE